MSGGGKWRLPWVVLGVAVVGVPTVFTVMAPEAAHWSTGSRSAVLVLWVPVVAVGAWFARKREERGDEMAALLWDASGDESVEDWSHHWAEAEQLVSEALVEHLLEKRWPGMPKHYDLTVYIYDGDRDMLSPAYPVAARGLPIAEFSPGAGATGTAWEERDLIVVQGEAVSDATYGLTPEQQRHFRRFQVVAGVPVSIDGEPIGVLTAISKIDDGFFNDPVGRQKFRQLSYAVGIVIEGGSIAEGPTGPEAAPEERS